MTRKCVLGIRWNRTWQEETIKALALRTLFCVEKSVFPMAHHGLWLVNHTRGLFNQPLEVSASTYQISTSGGVILRLPQDYLDASQGFTLQTTSIRLLTPNSWLIPMKTCRAATMNPPMCDSFIHNWSFATKSKHLPRSIPVTGFLIFPKPFCAKKMKPFW